jgi:CBS domain-containing protein
MRCKDVMKTDVECLGPDDTAADAARCMGEKNLGFLPICEDKGAVIGTVTDRDLALRVIGRDRDGKTPIRDVMSNEQLISCSPSDDLETAEKLMAKHHKSRIVCLDDDGQLAGIISLSDILDRDQSKRAARTARSVAQREISPRGFRPDGALR